MQGRNISMDFNTEPITGFFPDAEDKSIKALRFKRKGNVITCFIKKAGSNTWEAYSSTLMAEWTDSIKKRLEGLK